MKSKTKKQKRKIRYDRIIIFLIIIVLIIGCFTYLFNLKISNIYILNNSFLNDQQIIEIAEISDYPSTLQNMSFQIEKRLESNIYIKEAKVTKKGLSRVYIEVEENRPLFYYEYNKKTILLDGQETNDKFIVPAVVNYITDSYYNAFIEQMSKLDVAILNRISEIQFSPNDVDDNRFLLTMNDGNYVYVNIDTFDKMNKYISILENLPNKNGILYLDYGNNFEIIE